jgi:uncharacterized protein (DUF1800 family)
MPAAVTFSPYIAERRFGYGLSGHLPAVRSVAEMLDGVTGPDVMVDQFPQPPFSYIQEQGVLRRRFSRFARENPNSKEGKEAQQKSRALFKKVREERGGWFIQTQLRRAHTTTAFRERLIAFWADHFTTVGKGQMFQFGETLYRDAAVRPHVAGRFGDLLVSCVTHPMMLHYLDQDISSGPNSDFAKRRGKGRGLNENLAREVLELHTLGVDGPYDQRDVRGLALLFTGMSRGRDLRFMFRQGFVEPGAHRVLGKRYGGKAGMTRISKVLQDLALHPATAAHIAHKLAVHFVADVPPPALVAKLATVYRETGGELMALYEALLNHPLAWDTPATNIRPPVEFVVAAMRALSVPPDRLQALTFAQVNRLFLAPVKVMGQYWQQAPGPDGWDEADAAWITPQGVAGRVEWAMRAPQDLVKTLPDPRDFVHDALGDFVPERVEFAAQAAETQAEAIGLVLLSPAFQRR